MKEQTCNQVTYSTNALITLYFSESFQQVTTEDLFCSVSN